MKKFKAKETQSEPVAVPPSVLQHLDEATAKAVGLQEDLPDFVRRLSEASEGFRTASSAFQQQMHLKELANLVSRVAQTEDELDPFVVTEVYVAAEKVLVEFLLCIAGHKSAKSFAIYVAKFMFDTRLGRQERKRAKEFFRERLHRAVDSFLADDAASTIAVSSTEPIPAKTFFRLQQFEVVYESDQLAGEVPDRVMLKILASYGRQIDRFARVLTHRAREGTSAVQSLADQSDIFISLIKSATQLIQKCARRLHSSLQKEIKGGSASTEEGGEPKMSAEIQFLLETLPSSLVDIASTGGLSRDAVTQSLLLLLQILVTACSIDELTAVLSRWNESPHPERQGAVGSDVRTEVRKLEMLARSPQLRANPQTRLAAMRGLLVAVPATAGGAVDLFHLEDPSGADASVSLGRLSSEWSILATSFFEETAALCGHTDARLRHTALQSLHVWVSRLLGSSSFACSGAGGGGGGKSKREGGDIFPVFSGDEFTALPAGALPFSADETDGEEGPTPVSRGLWPDWTLFKLPEEKRAAIEEKTLAVVFENWDHPTKSLVAAAHDLWDLLLFQAGPGRISGGGGKGGDRERGENQNQGEGGDGREISGKSSRRSVVEEEEQRADDPPRPPPPSLLSITRRLSALPEAVASKKSLYLAFCSLLPLVDIASVSSPFFFSLS
uniref:Uncharacterized protein n=1 Tax=Chromera velia CCMP2878 TaxID=1169474 RepID=A0A0K6SA04_9ALVE|eukprot:Cvel_1350.t1-p1 / transcript=Cvel_1350.t1 / gene=Cvel_1350 / organism=Chromera_velia_CCMP2878 / gene_product=hypothetical protein / transcript_product=hypothetical protein / location=Cvel_scaffold46:97049-99058(-) / protein_length=670 / sequence_SO=supercontig / SO=protein_coding / is_pseudo=false